MRSAEIYYQGSLVGRLTEVDDGYEFSYTTEYLQSANPKAVNLTLPITQQVYRSNVLFPCFDGLIPEGWLLDVASKNWKLNPRTCHMFAYNLPYQKAAGLPYCLFNQLSTYFGYNQE